MFFFYNQKKFHLPRHGFAREKLFRLAHIAEDEVHLELSDDDQTLPFYPFYFTLLVKYKLLPDNAVNIQYLITNRGKEKMFFSIGGHPAFKIPFLPEENFDDYFLEFNNKEMLEIFPLSNGLLQTKSVGIDKRYILSNGERSKLRLHKSMFEKDALVFKNMKSDSVSIQSTKNSHSIAMKFSGFKYFGIWSAPGSDFVCLEPWMGIADSINSQGSIENKEGINVLEHNETFKCSYDLIVN